MFQTKNMKNATTYFGNRLSAVYLPKEDHLKISVIEVEFYCEANDQSKYYLRVLTFMGFKFK